MTENCEALVLESAQLAREHQTTPVYTVAILIDAMVHAIEAYTSHSPGHQSVLVTLLNSGPLLLTIDAAYTMDHWDEKALPGFMSSAVKMMRSVQKMHSVVDRTAAKVVTGQDPDAWPSFRQRRNIMINTPGLPEQFSSLRGSARATEVVVSDNYDHQA